MSCSEKNNLFINQNNKVTETPPHTKKTITYGNNITKTINFINIEEYKAWDDDCVYAWNEDSTSVQEMQQILSYFGIHDIQFKNRLLKIVLYYNKSAMDYQLVNDSVYGIYCASDLDGGYMFTQAYKREGNKFVNILELDTKVAFIYCSDLIDLAKIFNNRRTNLGYAVRIYNNDNKNGVPLNQPKGDDELKPKIEAMLKDINN